ncbi:MAG: hypothetical protein JNL01_10175 [Bdellovibrionales bacterium]|nr:hypothetical protein [Bdellovibrionales bacterium]
MKRPSFCRKAIHLLLIALMGLPTQALLYPTSARAEDEEPPADEGGDEGGDTGAPDATINGEDANAYMENLQSKQGADLNIDLSKEGAMQAGMSVLSDGGKGLKESAENTWNVLSRNVGTVGELNRSYKDVCEKDTRTVKDGKSGQGSGGNVDAGSMQHKTALCQLVHDSVKTAKLERVVEIAWGGATASCIAACASKTGTFGVVNLDALCSLVAQGAGLASTAGNAILQNDFGTAAKEIGNGLVQASNLGDKFAATKLGGTKIGGKIGEKLGAGSEGFKMKDLKANKGQKRGEGDQKESCSAIAKTMLQMIQARFRKKNAIGIGVDSLAGLKNLQMRKDGITFAGFDTKLKDFNIKTNLAGLNSAADRNGDGKFDDADGSAACNGAQGNMGLTISCMSAGNKDLAELFKNPDVQKFMGDAGIGQWIDADPSADINPSDLASGMGGMPPEFAPLLDQANQLAVNTTEAANAAPVAVNEKGAEYKQVSGGGAGRSPASSEESLEDMVKRMMEAQNAGATKNEDPSFDHALAFRYARDASGLSEDRAVSIFRRVSFRYQSVGRKDGLYSNLLNPAARAPASADLPHVPVAPK